MEFATKCIHSLGANDATGSITPAIYISSTFAHPKLGDTTGFNYTRESNPTRARLETLVAALEEGIDALAFSSGMAAVDAVMNLFAPSDHIITGNDLYGGSFRLFRNINARNGVEFTTVHTSKLEEIKAAIKPNTKAIFLETPTNPTMEISDLRAISKIAKENNFLVIVDNTFLTPYFQKPLALGADIVIHSGTKYLAGHNDVLAGFTVVKKQTLADKLRLIYKTTGACLGALDAWLVIRGIKTLPLRMEQHQKNAAAIAAWLQKQPRVQYVLYPGLAEHPGYAVNKAQTSGFGGMISFAVDNAETARQLLEGVKLIQFAESLGGTESLITYPIRQTHTDLTPEECAEKGITDCLLRLSTGIEATEDLIADLAQAFTAIQ
ncbi:PLP-dependent aspartate aminotransferase family protein [uncultured Phascolarctobacterium sp.]|uniref:trans-sulfuration enzyme family protein n=1 Tax=uncultured Phascolarctobacterium sp. TaxID=512296 RepID=UPI0025FB4E0A|nr:PLP-dependent aspartate aminotransferase family protein [uncultured Phascolarctobacterium sp.]